MKDQEQVLYQPHSVNLTALMRNPDLCEKQAGALQKLIAMETIEHRGIKGLRQYGKFFALFWLYGLPEPIRANLIRSSYFWFRHVDDIADGDKKLSKGYRDKQEYLQHKRNLVERLSSEQKSPVLGDEEDILLADYLLAARKLKVDLGKESIAILDTIAFDEERSRTRRVPTQQELDDYFDKLDFACIAGALKVAGETCPSETLADLSRAVRITFNLRDFPKDFKEGIINISVEDVEKYGIDPSKIEGKKDIKELIMYEPIRNWYRDQLVDARKFYLRAKDALGKQKFKPLTRLALKLNFVNHVKTTLSRYEPLVRERNLSD